MGKYKSSNFKNKTKKESCFITLFLNLIFLKKKIPKNFFRKKITQIVDSNLFQILVIVFTITNAVIFGLFWNRQSKILTALFSNFFYFISLLYTKKKKKKIFAN